MSGSNTYKRISDHEIEIDGVIYTDGGGAPTNGSAPPYPTEGTPPTGTGTEGSTTPPSYVYVPGSAAPTDGDPLSYAGWLQGRTKYQAEQDRIRVEKAAETDRQKQILDANNAYRTGLATYGAKAEKMASMGLSNSGYGEYLTGKAYATQRGEVQNANRTAQARIDQALYEEGKIQQQADAKYAEDLIGIKNQQNVDYGSLYDSALNGASIESIMQDSRWGTLTDEQRATIKTVTTQNSIKIRIDNGESLETIIDDPASGWNDLTVDQQNTLNTYSTSKTEAKNADYTSLYDSALNGASIESIMQDSRWGGLSPERQATIKSVTTANSIKAMLDSGKTLDEIVADANSGWGTLTVDQQNQLTTYYNGKVEADNAAIGNDFLTFMQAITSGAATLDDIKALPGYQKMIGTEYEKRLDEAAKKNKSELVDSLVGRSETELDDMPGVDEPIKTEVMNKNNREAYNTVINSLNTGEADKIATAYENIETFKANKVIDETTYNEIKALLDNSAQGLIYQYGAGKMSAADFVKKMSDSGFGNSATVSGGWYIQGLGSGKNNDDVDITIGGTTRDKSTEFDLLCGEAVTDPATISALNTLATGSADSTPSVENESAFGSVKFEGIQLTPVSVDSKSKPGKLVLYNGSLYLYTKKGWSPLKSDNNSEDLNNAIAAFMLGSNYSGISAK